jgi:hypothetical protein
MAYSISPSQMNVMLTVWERKAKLKDEFHKFIKQNFEDDQKDKTTQ